MAMTVAGGRFTKIEAHRNTEFSGDVALTTDVRIETIEKSPGTETIAKIGYGFTANYGDLGNITLEGILLLSMEEKELETLLEGWETKKFDGKENVELTNIILRKTITKAFDLEEQLGLPFHIKIPKVTMKKE